MKRIVIVTATRAEYGLLAPVIKKLKKYKSELEVYVVATGTHLSPEFGMTINEIVTDGLKVDKKIDILLSSDTSKAISKTMGMALFGFSEYFEECNPDALMVLGDRYETLAISMAAIVANIPIIHLYGGEATEGAVDELIRNAITKLSSLHFTSTEQYRQRVIQMGEKPENVYNVGAIGVENALNVNLMTKDELSNSLGCHFEKKLAILTFHPVTLEDDTAKEQIDEIIKVIEEYRDITFVCTKANADVNGRIINECLEKCANKNNNVYLFDSLGTQRYLSLIACADFVIGNSSSGIIEVPSLKKPTINIGDRQKGRIQAMSVINCLPIKSSICEAIDLALSDEFRMKMAYCENPYGNGKSSEKIADITKAYLENNKLSVRKKFNDIIF